MSARMIRLIALVFFLSTFLVAHGSLVALSKSSATAVPKAPVTVVPKAPAAVVPYAPAAVVSEASAAVVPDAPAAVVPDAPAAAAERIDASRQAPQVRRVSADQAFVLVAGEAEKGNPDAMLTLGGMYEQGIGIGRNFGKAREWYQKAAAAGLATGRYNVGVCWELGMGSEVNLEKALEEYQKAADMGLAQAMFKIFTLLSTSDDSPKDEQRSFDLGLPQAMFKLFAQPSTGGISKDKSRAFANLQKAADAGHADAAGLLGVTLLNGLSGQEKNQAKALTYLAIAAQAGNLEAMKNLGVVFKDGLGTNVSLVTALKWYLIALKGGYPAEAIQPIIDELRAQTGEAQAAKVEKDADDWIAAFKARQGGS